MSLEDAEARMMAPPSEDELKEKSERRKASKKASKLRKHVQAVQLSESDEAGFPMPLTIAEAKVLAISPGHQAKSKSALLSEINSKHEVNQRRFRTDPKLAARGIQARLRSTRMLVQLRSLYSSPR